MHDIADVIRIFNACFEASYNTQLVCGEDEPLYVPASETCAYNKIIFAHGYYSSALHECAHWLIAGEERRQPVAYGYWYVPDGRTAQQQLAVQRVEVKPQALEWVLSMAAGFRFQFSIDNLNGEHLDMEPFKIAVRQQMLDYQTHGLPARADMFCKALCDFYQTAHPCSVSNLYSPAEVAG